MNALAAATPSIIKPRKRGAAKYKEVDMDYEMSEEDNLLVKQTTIEY